MSYLERVSASMPWLKSSFLGNTYQAYLLALITILVGLALVWVLDKTLVRALKRVTRHTDSTFDDFVVSAGQRYLQPAAYGIVVFIGCATSTSSPPSTRRSSRP